MSWRSLVRPGMRACVASWVLCLVSCASSEAQSLEDRSSFVQGSVQLRRLKDVKEKTVGDVRQGLSALEPFTAVHLTVAHKMPGAGGPAWGADDAQAFGGVFVNQADNTMKTYGAVGGSDSGTGSSHGVYAGTAISDSSKKPLFVGAWQGDGTNVQATHAVPNAKGGMDVLTADSTVGTLPPGTPIERLLTPAAGVTSLHAKPNHSSAQGGRLALATRSQQFPHTEHMGNILSQPVLAETMTVAFRPPGPNHTDLGVGLPKDDVLVAGGRYQSDDKVHGSLGGVGGYSDKDHSFHIMYGSGLYANGNNSRLPGGSAVGTLSGKPGTMDVTNLQPTEDGGADVTSLKLRTQHVSQKELKELLVTGALNPAKDASSPPAPAPKPASPPGQEVTPQPPVSDPTAAPTPAVTLPPPVSGTTAAPAAGVTPPAPASSTPAAPPAGVTPPAPASGTAAPPPPAGASSTTLAAPGSTTLTAVSSSSAAPTVAGSSTLPPVVSSMTTTEEDSNVTTGTFEPGSFEDAISRITHKMGDLLRDFLPPSVDSWWAVNTATQVADALLKVFEPLKEIAENLFQETMRIKDSALSSLGLARFKSRYRNGTQIPGLPEYMPTDVPNVSQVPAATPNISDIAPGFQTTFYRGMMSLASKWRTFHFIFNRATAQLTGGLRRAGQGHLADRLDASFNKTDAVLVEFADRIERAMEKVPEVDQMAGVQLARVLDRTNAELYEAYRALTGLAASRFVAPVEELMDHVTDAISSSGVLPDRVMSAFGLVEHVTTAVQWRLRAAGRELVLGAHEAVVTVASRAGLPKPSWPPPGVEPVGPDPLGDQDGGLDPWSIAQKAWNWFRGPASGLRAPGVLIWLALAVAACSN